MKITVTGMPGAGKSTIAAALSKKLGLKRYYMGQIRRDMAKKLGMTLDEFNKLGETDPTTDIDVDNYQKELGKNEDNIIIEGRTSFFLIPDSIKLFIDVKIEEGARRIFKDTQDKEKSGKRNEGAPKDEKEMTNTLKKRIECDRKRYKKYYNVDDVYDKGQFDIIIDTTDLTAEQSAKTVLDKIKEFTSG